MDEIIQIIKNRVTTCNPDLLDTVNTIELGIGIKLVDTDLYPEFTHFVVNQDVRIIKILQLVHIFNNNIRRDVVALGRAAALDSMNFLGYTKSYGRRYKGKHK